jgi:ribonuclease P protein component
LKKYSLNSTERIKHRKIIEEIFSKGSTVYKDFIRINYIKADFKDGKIAKVAFSVPKKKFKRAYKRNRLKRVMREVYRKNKPEFYDILSNKSIKIALLFVYLDDEIKDYDIIEKTMKLALDKLVKKLEKE